MTSVLKVSNLKKSFSKGFIPKKSQVLHGVNFDLKPGSITGFLGANGAGKTTTMKCLLGLIFFDQGEIEYFGQPGLTNKARSKIGFLPEKPYFYDYLTGTEFLSFHGGLAGLSRQEIKMRSEELLKRVDLFQAKDKRLRQYSKGMLQKIGIAQALIHRPEFVILDEPMSGLDPDGRHYLSEIIKETSRQGTTVFFSSHLIPDVERLCENLVILSQGRVIFEGQTKKLLDDSGEKFILRYWRNGDLAESIIDDQIQAQDMLKKLVGQGIKIEEFRSLKLSLEEVFIKTALRKTQ